MFLQANDSAVGGDIYIYIQGRIITERSSFPDPAAWLAAADWDTGAEQVCDALTSGARGNVGIWPQWLRGDRRASG